MMQNQRLLVGRRAITASVAAMSLLVVSAAGADSHVRYCGADGGITSASIPDDGGGTVPRGILTGCDDGTVIDMLVVYTPAARTAAGGTAAIEARIDAAIADTNTAFANSLIDTSVNLVHTQEISYTETGNSDIDGQRLLDPDDGFLDNVPALRDQYAADIAVLWVDSLDTGGRVLAPMDVIGEGGFHEMRQAEGTLTMAHELGHNLGCVHDRPNAYPYNYFPYSYGYHEPGGAFHTIMAVVPPNTPLIPYFSNPDVTYMGLPTGVPIGQLDESNCAATIQQTRHVVANYRNQPMAGLPAVLHVDAGAPPGGDGGTWATALNDLQDALCLARRSGGDVAEIWVRAGTYTPDRGTDLRIMAFVLENNLGIYGGFDGTETLRSDRDPEANPTILSGEIGVMGDTSDNSVHVVFAKGVNASAILDGFTIRDGHADTVNHFFNDVGGGIWILDASPTIADCVVTGNAAGSNGGGICVNGGAPTLTGCAITGNTATNGAGMGNYDGATPNLTSCSFVSNTADFAGGGVHNEGTSPSFTMCQFSGNSSEYGGAVENHDNASQFQTCQFMSNNTATQAGGAVHNNASTSTFTSCTFAINDAPFGGAMRNLDSSPTLTMCAFNGNTADSGGAIANDGASGPTIESCSFALNMADIGGAVYGFDCAPVLNGCLFATNSSVGGGGAVATGGDSAMQLTDCKFNGNMAGFGGAVYGFDGDLLSIDGGMFIDNSADNGGALYLYNAGPRVRGATFDGNIAGDLAMNIGVGGAIFNVAGSASVISLCTFIDNVGGYGGGAIRNQDSDAVIVNCGFYHNQVKTSGGAIENLASHATIAGCYFSGNVAIDSYGGAIATFADSQAEMSNLTIVGNSAGFAGGGIANDSMSPALWNSIVWGNTAGSFDTESQQVHNFDGSVAVDYSTIQGWSGAMGGVGNNGMDPMFADPDGPDDMIGTSDDGARPTAGSPANDSGNDLLVAADAADIDGDNNELERLPRDLDNKPRFLNDGSAVDSGLADPPDYLIIVDRGAFEFGVPSACATCVSDLNGDDLRDGDDLQQFVSCVLSGPGVEAGCACADVDADESVTVGDVMMFVDTLLNGNACP